MLNKKLFIRTIHSNNLIECSWYNGKGRRWKHKFTTFKGNCKTVASCDARHGYLAYAKANNYDVVDNFPPIKHPSYLTLDEALKIKYTYNRR